MFWGLSVGKGIDCEVVISNRTFTLIEHVCTVRLRLYETLIDLSRSKSNIHRD